MRRAAQGGAGREDGVPPHCSRGGGSGGAAGGLAIWLGEARAREAGTAGGPARVLESAP